MKKTLCLPRILDVLFTVGAECRLCIPHDLEKSGQATRDHPHWPRHRLTACSQCKLYTADQIRCHIAGILRPLIAVDNLLRTNGILLAKF